MTPVVKTQNSHQIIAKERKKERKKDIIP